MKCTLKNILPHFTNILNGKKVKTYFYFSFLIFEYYRIRLSWIITWLKTWTLLHYGKSSLIIALIKGTVSVISSNPPLHAKMAMTDSQRYPGNLNLIKNVKDTFVCFWLEKCLILIISPLPFTSKKCVSHFRS